MIATGKDQKGTYEPFDYIIKLYLIFVYDRKKERKKILQKRINNCQDFYTVHCSQFTVLCCFIWYNSSVWLWGFLAFSSCYKTLHQKQRNCNVILHHMKLHTGVSFMAESSGKNTNRCILTGSRIKICCRVWVIWV